ncbi:MAG: aldo/keto reductase [Vicinamibacterales bacterium]
MQHRRVSRIDFDFSAVGYGMWGMGAWTGSDDEESARALDLAVERGCNVFDTAWAYGDGKSERLLAALLRRHPGARLYTATKVPPQDGVWPGRGTTPVSRVFPYDHVIRCTERSRENLGVEAIDLQQLHVWDDSWAADTGWQRAAEDLKRRGLIRAFGISVNRWMPENVLAALDTGLVDAVQVVYNIFDQSAADVLFPTCARLGVAVIARVPFDEGSLTGTLTADATWPEGDFRNAYFTPAHLAETMRRLAPLEALVGEWGLSLPDAAIRFVLAHPAVTTTIPGMRRPRHVEMNLGAADAPPLTPGQLAALAAHAWRRRPEDKK